jgi:hypothetical protein
VIVTVSSFSGATAFILVFAESIFQVPVKGLLWAEIPIATAKTKTITLTIVQGRFMDGLLKLR